MDSSPFFLDTSSPRFIANFDQSLAEAENALNELIAVWTQSKIDLPHIPEHERLVGLCIALIEDLEVEDAFELLAVAIRMLDRERTKQKA